MANAGNIFGGAATGAASGAAVGGPVGAAVGGVAGGLFGAFSGNDSAEQAQANLQKALAQLDAVGVPPDLARPLILKHLQQGGMLTPAYEQALSTDNFNASQIQEQPGTRTDLTATLAALKGMSQGGLNPEQVAAAQKLKNQVNANTESQIKGLIQRQQQQGQTGSGDTLAAELDAAQKGATNQSQGASDIGAQGFAAQSEALRSLLSGQGQLRQQDLGVLGQNAQLKQAADLWKAQNSSSRQARNTADTNAATQANWGRTNQVNDTNVYTDNQEQQRQRQAEQTQWADQLALAQAKSNAYMGGANAYGQMANNQNQAFNSTLQGVGSVAGAYGAYKNNQKTPEDDGSNGPPKTWENGGLYADGGMVQHPDEMMAPQMNYADGGKVINFLNGGNVPGVPVHPGNDYRNDVVPAMVSPGEIVVPNTHSHNPAMAAKFVKDQIEDRQMEAHGPMFKKLHERLKKVENKKV